MKLHRRVTKKARKSNIVISENNNFLSYYLRNFDIREEFEKGELTEAVLTYADGSKVTLTKGDVS